MTGCRRSLRGRVIPAAERLLQSIRAVPRTLGLLALGAVLAVLLGGGYVPVPCPFRLLTGLDCPLCGGSRMVGALLRADPFAALDFNAYALLVLGPVLTALLIATARWELGRGRRVWPAGGRGRLAAYALAASAIAWTIVRNLPFEQFTAA